jgi:outer membrane protein TolC
MSGVTRAEFEEVRAGIDRLRAEREAREQAQIDEKAGEILRVLGVAPKPDPSPSPTPGAAPVPKRPGDPVADMLAAIERQRGRG